MVQGHLLKRQPGRSTLEGSRCLRHRLGRFRCQPLREEVVKLVALVVDTREPILLVSDRLIIDIIAVTAITAMIPGGNVAPELKRIARHGHVAKSAQRGAIFLTDPHRCFRLMPKRHGSRSLAPLPLKLQEEHDRPGVHAKPGSPDVNGVYENGLPVRQRQGARSRRGSARHG